MNMYDQQITLGYFFPILKSKGIYFLEDLHTDTDFFSVSLHFLIVNSDNVGLRVFI